MKKGYERNTSKFNSELNYLVRSLATDVHRSMQHKRNETKRPIASNFAQFRKKTMDILNELEVEMPPAKRRKKKKVK